MMLKVRAALACGMIVIGSILIVRALTLGLFLATVQGVVLGAAVLALGLYRLKQIRAATRPR